MIPLFPNDFIEHAGKMYRLIDIQPDPGLVSAIPYGDPNAMPKRWTRQEFDSKEFRATLKRLDPPAEPARPFPENETDKRVQSTRLHRIKPLITTHRREIYDSARLKRLAKDRAATLGCSYRTVLNDVRRWMQGGQSDAALLGSYFQSGRIDTPPEEESDAQEDEIGQALAIETPDPAGKQIVLFAPAKQKARGRKPTIREYEKFSIPRELRRHIAKRALALFRRDDTVSVRLVADTIAEEYFFVPDENGNPKPREDGREGVELLPKGQRPTTHQIRYLIRKLVTKAEAHRSRVGAANFTNNHSPADGRVEDACVGPSDVYEVDATFVDLWLVAKRNRRLILGKATLYLVVDRASRLIVGVHLSLENPSWSEAKLAILSIAGDWKALCERLGVPYREEDWVATGVMPNRFFADRGEFNSFLSDVLCDGMQVPISNAPALHSRRKCIVEGSFATTQVPLKDSAPGYEPPRNARKRRGKHYEKDACLELDELFAIYLRIIIVHNRKIMKGYRLDPKWMPPGFQASPINIWNCLIEKSVGVRPRHSYDFLKLQLMPIGTATVHQDGIHFEDCIYVFDDPVCARWQASASLGRSFAVTVVYTPALVDELIVVDRVDPRRRYVASLTSKCETYRGCSFAEVAADLRGKQIENDIADEINEQNRIGLACGIRATAASALAATKEATKGMSLTARLRNADDERYLEARLRRRQAHSLAATGASHVLTSELGQQGNQETQPAQVESGGATQCEQHAATPNPQPPESTDTAGHLSAAEAALFGVVEGILEE